MRPVCPPPACWRTGGRAGQGRGRRPSQRAVGEAADACCPSAVGRFQSGSGCLRRGPDPTVVPGRHGSAARFTAAKALPMHASRFRLRCRPNARLLPSPDARSLRADAVAAAVTTSEASAGSAIGSRAAQGRGRGAGAGFSSRWSPRRRPPNRTCEFDRFRLSMSTSSGCPLAQLALCSEVPAPRVRQRRAGVHRRPPSHPSVPRAHWTPSPCGRRSRPPRCGATRHDYYGSSATSRRQQRTVRLPRTHHSGSAGTAGTLPTFTHRPAGRVGVQLYPGGIAARYRNPARGLVRPISNRTDETVPKLTAEDRAPQQPIAASFGAAVPV